jgi:hypothetical protein
MFMDRTVTRAASFLFTYPRRHRPLRYGGLDFSEPKLMTDAMLPAYPGIYAIHVQHWWKGFEPIHFGATQNLREDITGEHHVDFLHWLMDPRSKHGLWVSFNPALDLDHDSRHREGARLNRHYFPLRTHSVDEHLSNHHIHRLPRPTQASDTPVQ